MRIFIAYKYSNVPDKEKLIFELGEIAGYLESLGHKTFVLGRDIHNWGEHKMHSTQKILTIFINMLRSHIVLAYVTHKDRSKGLIFEMYLAKLLRKKIYVASKKNVGAKKLKKMAYKHMEFKNIEELLKKLRHFTI
jgi:hypothetical protein